MKNPQKELGHYKLILRGKVCRKLSLDKKEYYRYQIRTRVLFAVTLLQA